VMKKATERIRTADRVIRNQLPTDAYVRLQVYDLLGRKVATLLAGKQQAGHRSLLCEGLGLSLVFISRSWPPRADVETRLSQM